MVQITHVRVSAPGTHESHITDVRWYDPQSGKMDVATIPIMVQFINVNKGRAYICNGTSITDVEVVQAATPYIRTKADASLTDNLLSLPQF